MSKKSSKNLYVAALILFLAGIGYLACSNLAGGAIYSIDVSEAVRLPLDKPKSVRIFGKLNPDGLTMQEGGASVRFRLEDKNNPQIVLWATYSGALPDTFVPGAHIYLEGTFTGSDDVFVAKKLMTQCPSKYEKQALDLKQS